jgi:redox-sensitive bicupin YhaK (pirin superfamily)
MANPAWQDLPAAKVPEYTGAGFCIKAIAGSLPLEGLFVAGAFERPDTQPIYWDVHLAAHSSMTIPLPNQFTGLIYTYEGSVNIGSIKVKARQLARLNDEGALLLHNHGAEEARLLVLAGAKLKEPIVQYGPFVMNTREEIEQALSDYREGTLAL